MLGSTVKVETCLNIGLYFLAQECPTGLGICIRRWEGGHLSSVNQGAPPHPEAANFTITGSFLWAFKEGPQEQTGTLGRSEMSRWFPEITRGSSFPLILHREARIFLPEQNEFISTLTGGCWHFGQ